MLDLDEPLDIFKNELREKNAQLVSDSFEGVLAESGVDESLNTETVAKLDELETVLSDSEGRLKWHKFGRVALWLVAALLGVLAAAGGYQNGWFWLLMIPAIASAVFAIIKLNPKIRELTEKSAELTFDRDAKADEAWAQVDTLNSMHTWETAPRLFNATMPDVTLDSYMTDARLDDLRETYGLPSAFNDNRSMLHVISGEIEKNPFSIARYIQHWMGFKVYTGSMVIYWTENVRDANGNWQSQQRSQVLTANVTKPFPEYAPRASVVYGHDSAPNLSFSRAPSNLSGLEEGSFNNWRKGRAVKKVESKARKAVNRGDGGLTVMANREFEALFNAVDRDNEVEFRVLFTPLAQQQMVNVLNDSEVGFGDDFRFTKFGMMNIIDSGHLANIDLNSDPRNFMSLSVAQARKFFFEFHTSYFRYLYFALAPLMLIPEYRARRFEKLRKTTADDNYSCSWEHEAIANYIGHQAFAHPQSITHNLLRVTPSRKPGEISTVTVTGFGYSGRTLIDYVPVRGNDGNIHQVPVEWIEYTGVSKDTSMSVGHFEGPDLAAAQSNRDKLNKSWVKHIDSQGIDQGSVFIRGSIAAALQGGK
jgi:hypothetical protein